MSDYDKSPPWGTATKALVAFSIMVLFAWFIMRFSDVIPLLILAVILTFIILPLTQFMVLRLRFPWGLASSIAMLLLVAVIGGASTATGVAIVQQLQGLFLTVQRFLITLPDELARLSATSYVFGPWVIDLSQFDLQLLGERLLATIQPLLGEVSGLITQLASGALESLARILFILAITYFITFDYRRIRAAIKGITIPGYTEDFYRLRMALTRIWQAFIRSQVLIVLMMGITTWALMSILGVRYAIGLGVLGGLAKFIPIVGPTTAGLIAALVALFQPANWLGLTPLGHAVLVISCVVILDNGVDYFIIPRIFETTLKLHPIVVLIGLVIGATLAGVLGLLLAAPTMASIILLGRYTYRKLFDLPPWDPPIEILSDATEKRPNFLRIWNGIREQYSRIRKRDKTPLNDPEDD
jgi:predicted PurR-regulated permease PerM